MSGTGLRVQVRGPVGWLVFDRPESGNAFDGPMMAALPDAWRELDDDPAVRAIVVTGAGRAFQTGLDMRALAKAPGALKDSTRRTRDNDLALTGWHLSVRTPTIVAVNGICAGGGLHFVVDADICIASTRASFLDPHVSVGQASNWEAVGLMDRIGASDASWLALLGSHGRMSAGRAHQLGLVSELVEPEQLEARAQELGEQIAEADVELVRTIKRTLWRTRELGLSDSLAASFAEHSPEHAPVPAQQSS